MNLACLRDGVGGPAVDGGRVVGGGGHYGKVFSVTRQP